MLRPAHTRISPSVKARMNIIPLFEPSMVEVLVLVLSLVFFQVALYLKQITFEMLHISKFSFSRKMRFAVATNAVFAAAVALAVVTQASSVASRQALASLRALRMATAIVWSELCSYSGCLYPSLPASQRLKLG